MSLIGIHHRSIIFSDEKVNADRPANERAPDRREQVERALKPRAHEYTGVVELPHDNKVGLIDSEAVVAQLFEQLRITREAAGDVTARGRRAHISIYEPQSKSFIITKCIQRCEHMDYT